MTGKLLITGASGLLGLNLALHCLDRAEVIGVANQTRLQHLPFELIQAELTEPGVFSALLEKHQPDLVIHCAAMANVDDCEAHPHQAHQVNGLLPGELAAAAAAQNVRFIHISTDAVFDGVDSGENGYDELDKTNPINVYAMSKLAGERSVLAANPNAVVARVNFFGWSVSGTRSLSEFFYNNLNDGKSVSGFTDVFYTPLYVGDLAEILWKLGSSDVRGLYHVFGSKAISKYQFGMMIADRFVLDASLIQPTSWRDAGLQAVRSPNLIMNSQKLKQDLAITLVGPEESVEHFYLDWHDGLPERLKIFRVDY